MAYAAPLPSPRRGGTSGFRTERGLRLAASLREAAPPFSAICLLEMFCKSGSPGSRIALRQTFHRGGVIIYGFIFQPFGGCFFWLPILYYMCIACMELCSVQVSLIYIPLRNLISMFLYGIEFMLVVCFNSFGQRRLFFLTHWSLNVISSTLKQKSDFMH